ncbi:MAG: hypothetical protein A2484_01405 [Nitrospirae bacterium RIFOXYC2_FULL_44_7]|nr:MAG: hypothetical protein A2484_01405 [Nitrospirae bacterium RIFOXYC2_FULL_44_7]
MNVGVIGCGYWGKKHIEAYEKIKTIKLRRICDVDQSKLNHPGVQASADYRDILKDPAIKAVSIVTPDHTHYKICKDCLLSSKHVLLEKPMALNYRDAYDLYSTAKRENLVLLIGHLYKFDQVLKTVKKKLAQNLIGEIRHIHIAWEDYLIPSWPRDIVYDLGSHAVVILNDLIGLDIIRNRSRVSYCANGQAEAQIDLGYKTAEARINLSWSASRKKRTAYLEGTKGCCTVDFISQSIRLEKNSEVRCVHVTKSMNLDRELIHFVDIIMGKKKTQLISAESGCKVIKTLDCLSSDSLPETGYDPHKQKNLISRVNF